MNWLKYGIVCILSVYFLVAGTGLNVVKYCCSECKKVGIEIVAENSCEAIHNHSHSSACSHHAEDMACSNFSHHTDCCHLLRLLVDDTIVSSCLALPHIVENALLNLFFVSDLFVPSFLFIADRGLLSFLPDLFLPQQGRIVLSRNCILLI